MVQLGEQEPCQLFQTQRGLRQGSSALERTEKVCVKWATSNCLCDTSCIQSQEAAAIHRWGNSRKALPDHSCPAAFRGPAVRDVEAATLTHLSLPHPHRARGRRILLPLFHFPNSMGRTSWANDTQKPTGRGSQRSNPKGSPYLAYCMPSLYLPYYPFCIWQNHREIMVYCYILYFLCPYGLISYCNFSRILQGNEIISCGHSRVLKSMFKSKLIKLWLEWSTG